MLPKMIGCGLVALLAVATGGLHSQSKAVTNNDIVEMAKLGLGDAVIVSKIKSSSVDFDTEAHALARLKQAGVSDVVLTAMIEADGQSDAVEAHAADAQTFMTMIRGDKNIPLTATPVQFESSSRKDWIPMGNFKAEYFIFLSGRHADTKTADTRPVFMSKLPPS
ncbi:MAG: hypothetical protein QM612_04355 [Thermomonas sp.]|uniref:hypothetical protein n=1 Tax=Thermomonas sp. TaxID=1971895 RepID=UPI0039E3353A